MIVKRLLAVLTAIGLIAGAWVVRDRVIEGDDADAADPDGSQATVIVCVTELATVCDQVLGDRFDVVVEPAGETLDALSRGDATPVVWVTFGGFPEMVGAARSFAPAEPFPYTAFGLGTSRVAAVVRTDTTAVLTGACGDPIDLGCLGEQTDLKPAVSPIDSGIGLLTIGAAFAEEADEVIVLDDQLPWARGLRRASDQVQLSGGTAVQTIQTRSSVAVALGVEAELSNSRREQFDVLYAEPMVRVRAVLMVPDGIGVPRGLADELGAAVQAEGWDDPDLPSGDIDALPSADQLLAIRSYWKEL